VSQFEIVVAVVLGLRRLIFILADFLEHKGRPGGLTKNHGGHEVLEKVGGRLYLFNQHLIHEN